jgi:alpha-N-arabinofuranosidase
MADQRRRNGRDEPWKVRFWGVGNENWGCGGHMRPEYYADELRRYATYLRDFGENRLFKIACGPAGADYRWTEVLMSQAASSMDGLALHYYCGTGARSRSATDFGEDDWFELLGNALRMDELLIRHGAVMDEYDPEKRIALVVDEWGTWHDVEPGTHPRFLYQQNTLRDAMVAALTLNTFHRHVERVRLANLAQTVNVLQALVLTREAQMILTPTYHVFDLYQVHQDADRLAHRLHCGRYEGDKGSLPAINASASRAGNGKVHISLCHLDPRMSVELACELVGMQPGRVTGRVLSAAAINAHNTFEQPDAVRPVPFTEARVRGDRLTVELPASSIVVLELS